VPFPHTIYYKPRLETDKFSSGLSLWDFPPSPKRTLSLLILAAAAVTIFGIFGIFSLLLPFFGSNILKGELQQSDTPST